MQVKPLLLFPCTHPACADCSAELRTCPTCRQAGEASEPHRQLQLLSQMLHCGQCGGRYGSEEHCTPTLLLPCHHHMCRGCVDSLEGCPQCSRSVTGGVNDSRFMEAVANWTLLPPPAVTAAEAVTAAAESDDEDLLEDLAQWLLDHAEIYTMSWRYQHISERNSWPASQRQLWNDLMDKVAHLADHCPELSTDFYNALGLPPTLGTEVSSVASRVSQAVRGRSLLPELFQQLPVHNYDLV
jgi:hypothetical protein